MNDRCKNTFLEIFDAIYPCNTLLGKRYLYPFVPLSFSLYTYYRLIIIIRQIKNSSKKAKNFRENYKKFDIF